ncbi:MAG: dihydrofolate reductase [Rubrivivax sp.]|nr:dihydrofolate reductase [Rubrivivax sp.]
MKLSLIAAVAEGGAIGRDNDLLWRHPADAAHFRRSTAGCPVIMGRRTWESLPARFRPLPGRRNLVVTRQAGYDAPGAETAGSLDEALARVAEAPQVFVIGGSELYAQALPRADELLLTEIGARLEGDRHFPAWDRGDFEEVARESHRGDDGVPFAFVIYRRRR